MFRPLFIATLAAFVVAVVAGAAHAAVIYCKPWKACEGTPYGDVIYGTAYPDAILGYGGNDLLIGGKGADTLKGGVGSDVLIGGSGSWNYLFGGRGNDRLDGVTLNPCHGVSLVGGAGFDIGLFYLGTGSYRSSIEQPEPRVC